MNDEVYQWQDFQQAIADDSIPEHWFLISNRDPDEVTITGRFRESREDYVRRKMLEQSEQLRQQAKKVINLKPLARLFMEINDQFDIARIQREIKGMPSTSNALARVREILIENGTPMTGYTSKRQAAEFMLTEAARMLAKFERFPKEDPCVDEEVIRFDRIFPQNPNNKWSYAGIRIEGKYYLTGGKSDPQGYTWPQLVDWMAEFVHKVDVLHPNFRTIVGSSTGAPTETPVAPTEIIEEKNDTTNPTYYAPRPIWDNPKA